MSNNTKLTQGVIAGFIAGGVVGAVLGLLYAPKPGKELRSDIRQKSGELAADVDEYLKDAQIKAKDIINEGKEKSNSIILDTKQKAAELLHDAETVLQSAKERVSGESGRLKSAVRAGIDAYQTGQNDSDIPSQS